MTQQKNAQINNPVNPSDQVSPSPNQNVKEAMTLALDLVKQQIALASGILVFSGTLLKTGALTNTRWLSLSWGAWVLSIFVGFLAIGRVTTLISEGRYAEMDKGFGILGMLQQLSLFLGIVCFMFFSIFG
jgi:hypothetical protein